MLFPQGDTFTRLQGFEIRDFPLLGELSKAIECRLPVCKLYCWQLCPTMWSSPMTKSLDPVIVTALWVDLPGESIRPAIVGFVCNCLVPEAWTMMAFLTCS